MLRLLAVLCVSFASTLVASASPVATVAEGFIVEQVADEPLVHHPMMGSFDDRGRLYVCESAGTNRPAAELVADPQDQIRILTDADGDGHFDTSTVFADKLVFPQGCLWYRGAVYTCSSPYLWKLEDTDGDDICDKRTVLVKSFGFSGNAADIHGPFLGPDGRFYWCDGRHGHEIRDLGEGEFGGEDTVAATSPDPEPGLPNPEGSLLTKGKAARIFSCRPDGSDVRVLCGGGMDNPVEVDFFETGECLGSVNLFYGSPRGDCLVHWIDGGVFPRYDQADSVAEFKQTGDLLTEVHNYGHVAVSGMTRYRTGALFGDTEVRPESAEFLVTQFNTHKVVHSVIQRDGATFRHIATRDLFISPDPDCHPTDVIEDADGSILVIDTGGWFRIGCPTSQVAKPQITGAIYRIRRKGTSYLPRRSLLAAIPAGEQVSPVEFAKTFRRSGGALRGAVVDRMVEESSTRPNDMMDALQDILTQNDPSEDGMSVAAYWTLSRMSDDASREWLQRTVSSPDHRDLALVSIRQLSGLPLSDVQRDALSAELIKLCASESSAIRRAAVTALGRIQPENRAAAAAAVLESLRGLQSERMMEHAATFALIQLADRETAAAALADANPQIRRAALIALDQMDGGNLQREQVVPLLDTDDPMLQKAVLDVISRHDGWAGEAFALVRDWIDDAQPDEGRQAILRGFLIARAAEPDVQQLVADSFSSDSVPAGSKLVLLEVMSRAAVDAWPAVWNDSLRGALAQSETDLRLQALRVVASRNLDAFDPELTALAASTSTDARLRSEAFAAVAPRLTSISDELFQFLAGRLQDSETPVIDKLRIVTGLSRAPLSDLQLQQLAAAFEPAGPAVAPALLGVYDRDASEAVGLMLVSRLQASPSAQTLSAGDLRRVAAHYPPSVLAAAAPLLAALEIDAARNAARLDELAATISGGNAEHGRELFHGKQSACSTCHRVNGAGAQVGPELSKIATIRQPRDLLESIVYPSQSFARGFEPYNVLLADGRVVSGIIARETATDVVLRTNDLSEIRIARTAIDEMQPSQTSIMPQGLEGRLTPDELRDLLAYLQSLK